MKMKVAAVLVGLAVASVSQLQAQSTGPLNLRDNGPNCDFNLTATVFNSLSFRCGGSFEGNGYNPTEQAHIIDWLKLTPTTTVDPVDGGGWSDASLFFQNSVVGPGPVSATIGQSTGSINFATPVFGDFALVLKGNKFFSIYLFDNVSNLSSLNYEMTGVASNDPGLSNFSVYGSLGGTDPFCQGPTCVEVPEPTSLAMVFGGLFGLAAVARRRRRNA